MSSHSEELGQSNHPVIANPNETGTLYATEAAMLADTTFNGDSTNLFKVVGVTSPLSLWVLMDNTPTFKAVSGVSTDEGNIVIGAQFSPELNYIFYDGWVAQENITITKGSLFAVTAPTGAAIIIDILIDGVAQTNFLTLAIATTHQLTDITDLVVTAGQRVGLKFTQIGSNNPGNGIIATLHYELT